MLKSSKEPNNFENISEAFGFKVPLAFAEFIMRLYENAQKDTARMNELFEVLTDNMLADDCAYQQTPPELFPIATMGVDGVHYGYVIHAPELELQDYPLGEFCPMDDDGVILVGNNTQEALGNFSGFALDMAEEESEKKAIRKLAKALKIVPNLEYESRYGESIVPIIPSNWHYIPSEDGIGVLAPREKFSPENLVTIAAPYAAQEYLKAATDALGNNYPATALYYLREAYWHRADTKAAEDITRLLVQCYNALNRPTLATQTENRFKKHFSK